MSKELDRSQDFFSSENETGDALWKYVQSLSSETISQLSKPDSIEVFQVMAFSGGGDARSMAGGVSKATLPTMAGMVSALSGVLAMIWVKNQVETNELLMGEYVSGHSKQGARK